QAGAAQFLVLLDKRGLQPKLAGADGSDITARSGADDNNVKFFHMCFLSFCAKRRISDHPKSKMFESLASCFAFRCSASLNMTNVAYSKIQREFFWVFDALLHFDEESNCFFAIDCAVIIAEREIHHRADFHFPVDCHCPWHDFVHPENAALRRI